MLPKMGKSGVITHAICCDARDAMNGLPLHFRPVDCRSPAPMVDATKLHPVYAVRLVISTREGFQFFELRFDRWTWCTAAIVVGTYAIDPQHPLTHALSEWVKRKITATAKYHGWV